MRTKNPARLDRGVAIAAVLALTLLSWAYTIRASLSMQFMGEEYMFSMWTIMMVAMMTPSVIPMLFTFSRASHSLRAESEAGRATLAFLMGYVVLWLGFGVVAAVVQGALEKFGIVSTMGASTNRALSAILLLSAGSYQFLPLKHRCLAKCRAPLGFLFTEWRDGSGGAFLMGLRHGEYCAGCCWLLMALLFVAGTMNLVWIAALTIAVLMEKIVSSGSISRLLGAVAIGGAAWVLMV